MRLVDTHTQTTHTCVCVRPCRSTEQTHVALTQTISTASSFSLSTDQDEGPLEEILMAMSDPWILFLWLLALGQMRPEACSPWVRGTGLLMSTQVTHTFCRPPSASPWARSPSHSGAGSSLFPGASHLEALRALLTPPSLFPAVRQDSLVPPVISSHSLSLRHPLPLLPGHLSLAFAGNHTFVFSPAVAAAAGSPAHGPLRLVIPLYWHPDPHTHMSVQSRASSSGK